MTAAKGFCPGSVLQRACPVIRTQPSLTLATGRSASTQSWLWCAAVQAGLAGMLGLAGSENVQGEDQKKLDILVHSCHQHVPLVY